MRNKFLEAFRIFFKARDEDYLSMHLKSAHFEQAFAMRGLQMRILALLWNSWKFWVRATARKIRTRPARKPAKLQWIFEPEMNGGAVQKIETHNRRDKLCLVPTSNPRALEPLSSCNGNTTVIRWTIVSPRSIPFAQRRFQGKSLGRGGTLPSIV